MNNKEIIEHFHKDLKYSFKIIYNKNPFSFKIYKKDKLIYDYFQEEKRTVLHPILSIKVSDIKDDSGVHHYNLMHNLRMFLSCNKFIYNQEEGLNPIRYFLYDLYRAYKKYKNKDQAREAYCDIKSRKYQTILSRENNLDLNQENSRLVMYGSLDNDKDYENFNNRDFLITDNTDYLYIGENNILDIDDKDLYDGERLKMKGKIINLKDKKWFYNSRELDMRHVDLVGEFI